MEFITNPHCEKPFLATNKDIWCIQFWYDLDGRRLPKKFTFNLNSSEFRPKSKGKVIESNKVTRKKFADVYIEEISELLRSHYFNPVSKEFETLDKADNSFIHFLEEYLSSPYIVIEDSSLKTYTSYCNVFKQYLINNNLADIKLKEVTKSIINDYLNQFLPSHRNGNLRYIKAVFNHCVENLEILKVSPIKSLKQVPEDESDSNKPFTEAEFDELLKLAKKIDYQFYMLLVIMYYTLRRPDEILKLTYDKFDFIENTIYFSGKITKTKKRQTATLPVLVMNAIKEFVDGNVKNEHFFLGSVKAANGWHISKMFNVNKMPLTYFQDKFKRDDVQSLLKEGQTLYSIKYTGVIYLKKEGHSNQAIMGLTGHTKESTLGIYAREYKAEPIIRKDNILV